MNKTKLKQTMQFQKTAKQLFVTNISWQIRYLHPRLVLSHPDNSALPLSYVKIFVPLNASLPEKPHTTFQ